MSVRGPPCDCQPIFPKALSRLRPADLFGNLEDMMLANACELYRDAGFIGQPASRYSSHAFANMMDGSSPSCAPSSVPAVMRMAGWSPGVGPSTPILRGFRRGLPSAIAVGAVPPASAHLPDFMAAPAGGVGGRCPDPPVGEGNTAGVVELRRRGARFEAELLCRCGGGPGMAPRRRKGRRTPWLMRTRPRQRSTTS